VADSLDPLASGDIVRVTGVAVIGQDRRDFQACAGGPEYWLDGPAVQELMELHEQLTPGQEPFESVFVDMLAAGGPPPGTGPGASLAGTVDVLELRRVAYLGWSCDEDDDDLVAEASGNEPFWHLEVRGGSAVLTTPEGSPRTFSTQGLRPSPEGWMIEGASDAGQTLTLTLAIGGCQDSMSGNWTHLQATLALDDERLQGCGFLGPAGEG
jgi:uncharacterized membrane protein